MAITMQGMTVDGMECMVHRLPPGTTESVITGYGMRIAGFGRGGKSGPGSPKPRYFEFFCISHLLEGHGFYWTPKGQLETFEAGMAVIMTPDFIHCYGGHHDNYIEDTVCFHGPVVKSLFDAGLIKPGLVKFGSERRLLPVIEKAMDPLESSQIAANIELQRLILSLNAENKPTHAGEDSKRRVEDLIEALKLSPERWWTVEEMASYCSLGEVHFRRLFREKAGMSPKSYMERLKMQRAIEMLVGGREPVAEIGRKLSYSDPFHFSRRFKMVTGMSPADYRRSMAY